MGKKRAAKAPESALVLPQHPEAEVAAIVDSHCHLASTFSRFRQEYPESQLYSVPDFLTTYYSGVEALIDVWCEAPVNPIWRELADGSSGWKTAYRFSIGCHPHNAAQWTDEVERDIRAGLAHSSNVSLGECGLDYHYTFSPREKQREVLVKQLRMAVELGKPLTIHTREADEDIYELLTKEVPSTHKIHVHCFTDKLELCEKLSSHFCNLVFGITGVTTFTTNQDTPAAIRHLAELSKAERSDGLHPFRIVLETDSPYMTPSNLPRAELGLKSGQKLPISLSSMIPWTAEFVGKLEGVPFSTAEVLNISRQNIRFIYGI